MVTPQALLKEIEIELVSLVWELGVTKGDNGERLESELTPKQQLELKGVVEEYKGIFQEMVELPPR